MLAGMSKKTPVHVPMAAYWTYEQWRGPSGRFDLIHARTADRRGVVSIRNPGGHWPPAGEFEVGLSTDVETLIPFDAADRIVVVTEGPPPPLPTPRQAGWHTMLSVIAKDGTNRVVPVHGDDSAEVIGARVIEAIHGDRLHQMSKDSPMSPPFRVRFRKDGDGWRAIDGDGRLQQAFERPIGVAMDEPSADGTVRVRLGTTPRPNPSRVPRGHIAWIGPEEATRGVCPTRDVHAYYLDAVPSYIGSALCGASERNRTKTSPCVRFVMPEKRLRYGYGERLCTACSSRIDYDGWASPNLDGAPMVNFGSRAGPPAPGHAHGGAIVRMNPGVLPFYVESGHTLIHRPSNRVFKIPFDGKHRAVTYKIVDGASFPILCTDAGANGNLAEGEPLQWGNMFDAWCTIKTVARLVGGE